MFPVDRNQQTVLASPAPPDKLRHPEPPMNLDPKLVTIHVGGVIALFSALGAITLGPSKKFASALHGIALLLILAIGFAMLQKPPMDQYWWMAKLGIWLFLGAAPALVKRKVMPGSAALTLCIVAGVAATWLARMKPF